MAQIDVPSSIEIDFLNQIAASPAKNLRRALLKLEHCRYSPHRYQSAHTLQAIKAMFEFQRA
jgi:hypothetical protein